MKRRIVQVTVTPEDKDEVSVIFAVADDGSLWASATRYGEINEWTETKALPDSPEVDER